MKNLFLLLVLIFGTLKGFSQTIFTYGGTAVGADEFLRAYNKNKLPVTDKEKSLREYIELYSKFKLKVQAAKELKLDTLQQLKYDLKNFGSQVEDAYLNDNNSVSALVDEAFERSQKDIHILHFFVSLNNKSTHLDSLNAFKIINSVPEEFKNIAVDNFAATKKLSENYAPLSVSDVGFVTVFSLPYQMENLVYNIKPGSFTKVYITKTGLHIFKNIAERKSIGQWKIAQILLSIPPDADDIKKEEVRKKAQDVFKLLEGGENFETLAKKYSEDRLTATSGGELPAFGTGKFSAAFEDKVLELRKDGEILAPFLSAYGYHILKRLQQIPTPSEKADASYRINLQQQIEKDARINIAKETFVKNILTKIDFKRNKNVNDAELFRLADTVTQQRIVGKHAFNNKIIFTFLKKNYAVADWLDFIKNYKLNSDVYKGETNKELLEKYIATSATDYYRKHLAEYNMDFKYQLQEFKEGNMLFEIMERNVWNKASNDSVALQNYYKAHLKKYVWDSSANVLLFNCSDTVIANKAITSLKKGIGWKEIATQSNGKIQADSGRYEIAQLQLPAMQKITAGYISSPVLNSGDNTTSFLKVLLIFPTKQQRNFTEARGLIINDYQNFLEEKWLVELKKKYPVIVNEGVLQSLIK